MAAAVLRVINNHLRINGVGGGVASGDDDQSISRGLWINGVYGINRQKTDGSAAGYNGTFYGGSAGMDFEPVDDLLLGASYSNITSSFKYKGQKLGNKAEAASHILSLYGQKQWNDKFIWQVIISYVNSSIKIKNQQPDLDKISVNKFDGNSYTLDGRFIYKITRNNVSMQPYAGLRYTYYKEGAYTIRNTNISGLKVSSRSDNLVAGILGVQMITHYQPTSEIQVIPILHVSIEKYFANKRKKIQDKFVYSDKHFKSQIRLGRKQPQIGYVMGGTLSVKRKNIEMSVAYNCLLQNKYSAHQGALKVKILF